MAAPPVTTIAGAGAAGLSLALMLDTDVVIHEATSQPGGLCRSTVIDEFTFDIGPHILGGIPEAVQWVIGSTGIEFVEGATNNIGRVNGDWVPHPFHDPLVGWRYMAKMWKADPAKLLSPALTAQTGRKPGGVSRYRYPAHGGYQAITDAWAGQLDGRIVCDSRLDDTTDYGRVVWTGPLEDCPYNALMTVTFGYEGPPSSLTAVYLPEDWTPFHRLSFPSAFAPSNAPTGCYSIQGEVSIAPGAPLPTDLKASFEETVRTLQLDHGPPIFRHTHVTPNAYPVPIMRPGERGQRGEYLHGRTGAHQYLNVDGVVAASMELAGRLNGHARTPA